MPSTETRELLNEDLKYRPHVLPIPNGYILTAVYISVVHHKMMHRQQRTGAIPSSDSMVSTYVSPLLNSLSSSSSSSTGSSTWPSNSTSSSSSSSSCPVLLSMLAWSVTLLLVSSCLGLADAGVLMGHPLGKRSFMDIQCKGVYDKSLFARLDRICEDCYNLFREPQLHSLCRKNCFTSDYFKGCLDVLLLQDEMEQIQTWIKQLHGAEPGV